MHDSFVMCFTESIGVFSDVPILNVNLYDTFIERHLTQSTEALHAVQ